jgi:hypothetical protein
MGFIIIFLVVSGSLYYEYKHEIAEASGIFNIILIICYFYLIGIVALSPILVPFVFSYSYRAYAIKEKYPEKFEAFMKSPISKYLIIDEIVGFKRG